MILFILSLIMICISSYLVASIFEPKRYAIGVVYFFIVAFAQIVLTFEILSLFSAISSLGVISLNIVFLICSIIFWNKSQRPLYIPDVKREFLLIKNALLKDKWLLVLAVAFVFFIVITVILAIFTPVNSYDALCYHLARVPFWLSHGNLSHFEYPDTRIFVMPINSELLYSWVLIFLKDDWFLGLFSFFGYFISIFVLYNFLGALNFCERKKLWSVFIFSSLASVLVEASSTETEIIIGGLVLASIFLYFYGVKEDKRSPIFFSSLAYALAIGTKTPAIMAMVGCFVLYLLISFIYKKRDFYKPILFFTGCLIVNFIVFASYNYVLNFINYSNPFGAPTTITIHSFFGGFKGFVANFLRFVFLMFDSSGFKYADYFGKYFYSLQKGIFDFLHIPYNLGVITPMQFGMNKNILDSIMGCGILGFLVFIPCLFYSAYKSFVCKFSKRTLILATLSLMFLINLIVLSFSIGFMIFSIRFVTFFVILSSPILVYSYMKKNNIFKVIIVYFSVSYMMVISTHIAARPFFNLIEVYKYEKSISGLRDRIRGSETNFFDKKMPTYLVKKKLEEFPNKKNIAVFSDNTFRVYPLKMMENNGWHLDFLLLEDLENYNLDKYDFIIIKNKIQTSEYIKYYQSRKNDYYTKNGRIYFTKKHLAQCVYVDREKYVIAGANKNKPALSICYVPDKYFASKGFKVIDMIIDEGKTEESVKNILIYKKQN